jgi:predicted Zn-dependent protease
LRRVLLRGGMPGTGARASVLDASVLEGRKRPEEVVQVQRSRAELFRRLLERDPENPMVLYSLGSELFKEERYSEARDYLRRAVANKPDYSVAYRTLGRAHFELGENAEARRVFARGREVAAENGDLQTVKEIDVFVRRLERREAQEG